MAVTLGHTSSGNVSNNTGFSFNHTATNDKVLICTVTVRKFSDALDVTGFSGTYNGKVLSFAHGSAAAGIAAPNGTAPVRVLYILNPDTGTNSLSFSWNEGAYATAVCFSFSGAASIGSTSSASSDGTSPQTATVSIASGDAVFGGGGGLGPTTDYTMNETNPVEVSAAGNTVLSGADYNTGSGNVSVSLSGTGGVIVITATQIVGIVTPTINLSDALTATEQITTSGQLSSPGAIDVLTTTESVAMFTNKLYTPIITDSLTVSEQVTIIPKVFFISVSDSTSISDVVSQGNIFGTALVLDILTCIESVTIESFRFSPGSVRVGTEKTLDSNGTVRFVA